jgi:hypothetical protein
MLHVSSLSRAQFYFGVGVDVFCRRAQKFICLENDELDACFGEKGWCALPCT